MRALTRIMHEPPAATGWGEAERSPPQRRIVAPLIVESEASLWAGLWWKAWEALLSSKEGRGSACALLRRPPCLRLRAVLHGRWHDHLHDLATASRA